jgi:hypothetical protein
MELFCVARHFARLRIFASLCYTSTTRKQQNKHETRTQSMELHYVRSASPAILRACVSLRRCAALFFADRGSAAFVAAASSYWRPRRLTSFANVF